MRANVLLLTFITSILNAQSAIAASLSTYRIYLDESKRSDKFIVHNRNSAEEQCNVDFGYRAYLDKGQVKKLTREEERQLAQPALERVRYSPKSFTLKPGAYQYIAFKYRPKIGEDSSENRSYMYLRCAKTEKKQGALVVPSIVHSIPLIVRNDRKDSLQVDVKFENVQKFRKSASFDLTVSGTRSAFGDIVAIDKAGKELAVVQSNVSLYPEMKSRSLSVNLGRYADDTVRLMYRENRNYGGTETFYVDL